MTERSTGGQYCGV